MFCVPQIMYEAGKGEKLSKDSILKCQAAVLGQTFPPYTESGNSVLKYLE